MIKKITESTRNEMPPGTEALVESERRYRRLFESAKDGILILDAETGIVVDVNPFLLDLLDYPVEEFVGKAIWELGSFRDIVANRNSFEELQRKEYIRYEDKPLESSGGKRHEVEFVSNVYLVDHKKVIQCNIRDITERKQAEEALREALQITEGIINAIPVRVFWKDKNLVFLGCNAAFARDAGFSDPKNVIGKDDYQMGWRDQAEQYRADDRQTIESGCSISNREELQTTPSGTVITLLTSKIPLRDGQGNINGVIGTYLDITQQRQMEVQLRQTQKMEAIGQLVGGVAHDFNNMLQIILGHAEIVIDKTAPDNPITGSLQEIQEAARRSAALTRQLLAFARKQDIAPEILNLNDAVAGMLKMIQRLIGEDINLVWRPGTDLRPVKLDPSQIDQILANLCLNARDAIVGVGTITLETGNVTIDEAYCAGHAEAVPGEYVFLAVSDNGCGMDRETLTHIFEPFFTTKDVGKGTGLGLATVYGIVKQNNGFIYTYSEPDQGTTFRIYLPQAEAEVKTPAENRAEAPAGREETILLAEDDPSLRALCTLFLEDLGYNVLTTETSKEALALAEQHPGDIQMLLTDVVMPEMNGRQLSEKVLAVKPDMRVLFMSGYTADMIAQRGVLDQNVAFLTKPFTRNELARKVRDVLNT